MHSICSLIIDRQKMAILSAGFSIYWIRDWIRNPKPWQNPDSRFESLKNRIFEKLSSEHKYFTLLWNYTKTKILMCVLLMVSLLQKSSFRVLLCSSVHKNVSSYFALPKYLPFMCRNRAKTLNFALSIQTRPLNKAVFSLGGLGFWQKLCICMPELVMLITHFGQKCKYCPSKWLSWVASSILS